MPNFTGQRQRNFYIAENTAKALEHVLQTRKWPNENWSMHQVRKNARYIGIQVPEAWATIDAWDAFERYCADEERADKNSWFAKLLPF